MRQSTISTVLSPSESSNPTADVRWQKDNAARNGVDAREGWQGCVGMGLQFTSTNLNEEIIHGDVHLVPNSHVKWLAARSIPVGRFPGAKQLNRRSVLVANAAVAVLRHGLPYIDFRAAGFGWDLGRRPFGVRKVVEGERVWHLGPMGSLDGKIDGVFDFRYESEETADEAEGVLNVNEHPSEYEALVRIAESMTYFARYAMHRNKRETQEAAEARIDKAFNAKKGFRRPAPVDVLLSRDFIPARLPWALRRPGFNPKKLPIDRLVGDEFVPEPLHRYMPIPYLAIPRGLADQAYWLVTEAVPEGTCLACVSCGQLVDIKTFNYRADSLKPFDYPNGDFDAKCPECRKRVRWFPSDGIPAKIKRRFTVPFKEQFIRDFEYELPLVLPFNAKYLGVQPPQSLKETEFPQEREFYDLDIIAHRFKSEYGNVVIHLPKSARINVKNGKDVEGGTVWAHAWPGETPKRWKDYNRLDKWNELAEVCGSAGMVSLLQSVWFQSTMIWSSERPEVVFWPSDLLAPAARELHPEDIYWDLTPSTKYVDGENEFIIFPAARVHKWFDLEFKLPGDAIMNAGIGDPRLLPYDPVAAAEHVRAKRAAAVKPMPKLRPPAVVHDVQNVSEVTDTLKVLAGTRNNS